MQRSLNLAYLENDTYDQIVAHLERELDLSGFENDAELTMPKMTARAPNDNQQNTEQTKIVCHYCKKPGHVIRKCRERMKRAQEQKIDPSTQNTKPSISKSISPSFHSRRTIHPAEKCWSGPKAAHRTKQFKQVHPADKRKNGQEQGNSTHPGPSSILKNPLN